MNEDLRLHGLLGGSGGSIKSIQRGEISLDGSATTTTISITEVDLTKSVIIINVYGSGGSASVDAVRANFASSTSVVFTRSVAGGIPIVAYQVIEFNNVKSLQSGLTLVNTVPQNVTITAVNPAKSIVFSSLSNPQTAQNSSYVIGLISLTNSTNLKFHCRAADISNYSVQWYVIEFK